jgi:diadenosine tetraphosphate (Ap4A) HIT family hydrolase
MPTAIHRAVEDAREGELDALVARMPSGWLIMGEKQVVRGYCLLLPDPVVPQLNALSGRTRAQFLQDMALAGDVLLAVTGARRINYEILGNLEPALHVHLFPRYDGEPDAYRTKPVWSYDWSAARAFDPGEDGDLQRAIREALFVRL